MGHPVLFSINWQSNDLICYIKQSIQEINLKIVNIVKDLHRYSTYMSMFIFIVPWYIVGYYIVKAASEKCYNSTI